MGFLVTDVFKRAIERFGEAAQEDVLIEEMSELTKAIIKNRRKPSEKTKRDILEEMADVQIMLDQMTLIFGDSREFRAEKILRLKNRLDALEEEEDVLKEC